MDLQSTPNNPDCDCESKFITNPSDALFEKIIELRVTGATSHCYIVRRNGREYFMKRLKPELQSDENFRNLYRKEYDLGSQLDSPYIVKYEQLNIDEQGTFILCENICGLTLYEKLAILPAYFKDSKNLRRFVLQLLEGIDHMHQHHIVHADLKPQNVMLTQVNNDVKIIDLGYAFAYSHSYSTGHTPSFSSPEQKKQQTQNIDATTDIYALGRLLEYIDQNAERPLPRLYRHIMQRCLLEDQSKRYQSAQDIIRFIKRRDNIVLKTAATLFLLLAIGFGINFYCNSPEGQFKLTSLMLKLQQANYDFEANKMYYRFTNEEQTTCEVAGGYNYEKGDILSVISLPDGRKVKCTGIAADAFEADSNYISVVIPEGISYIGSEAFFEQKGIVTIHLPNSVTSLGSQCFAKMTSLENLILPDSITTLPTGMAHHCEALQRIVIPDKVKTLPLDAFAACIMLEEVVLPKELEHIERGVFWMCTALEQITLPATLRKIDEYAFHNCGNLKHMYLHATTPPEAFAVFHAFSRTLIHVPKGTLTAYKADPYWKHLNIVDDL